MKLIFKELNNFRLHKTEIKDCHQKLNFGGKEYIVANKLLKSFETDKVKVNTSNKNVYFKTDLGIPIAVNNGEIDVRGTTAGDNKRAVYAYIKQDSTEKVVGKLNLISFDETPKTLCLVGLNGYEVDGSIKTQIQDFYKSQLVKLTVETDNINCDNWDKDGNGKLKHGDNSIANVYNSEQKAIINALKEKSSYNKDPTTLFLPTLR